MKEITAEKLDKYFSVTQEALEKVKISSPEKTYFFRIAEDHLAMARDYFSDAKHFREKGDFLNAFAALNYAHGWLDAGARLGAFDVDHDSKLFTVD
ncbi:MAG: DUF357 domain-containing protein [Nanobdellota archaeon]